jgi:hypothetical protein
MTDLESKALVEAGRAKQWRRSMSLTMDDLSRLTGYSREAIFLFERGHNSTGKPHAAPVWRRYKLACMAVRFLLHYKIKNVDHWNWA